MRSIKMLNSTMIKDLAKFWERECDSFPPEAHNLKHEFKDRWVRFHSLPKSKRYPENEQEYLEVLRRHNIVLQELVGKKNVLVVLPEYSESKEPAKPEPELTAIFPTTEPWCSLEQHEVDDDYELYWHLHVSEVSFTGCELNSLFRLVANDEAGNIMIINPSKGVVYHPYDGGADIVVASTKQRDQLKEKHNEWLAALAFKEDYENTTSLNFASTYSTRKNYDCGGSIPVTVKCRDRKIVCSS